MIKAKNYFSFNIKDGVADRSCVNFYYEFLKAGKIVDSFYYKSLYFHVL